MREALSTLSGVGPKVADCVALFSLDQASAIPVDTHVWDIACRDLDPELTSCGSLTPKVYQRVGELFRTRYGDHAGWAHSLLFAAELPLFTGRLPASMREEMAAFRAAGKAARMQEKVDRAEAKKEGRPYTAKQPYKKPVVTTPSKAKAKEEASTGKKKDKKRRERSDYDPRPLMAKWPVACLKLLAQPSIRVALCDLSCCVRIEPRLGGLLRLPGARRGSTARRGSAVPALV